MRRYPYLAQAQAALAGGNVAGCAGRFRACPGAYTGEVSAAMLKEFGCRYVIVVIPSVVPIDGDTDAVVAAKFAATLKAGLTPILFVGRDVGRAGRQYHRRGGDPSIGCRDF